MKTMIRTIGIALGMLTISATARAELIELVEIPTKWRLHNYLNDRVAAFYTGSSAKKCWNGMIQLPENASMTDRGRFYMTVMVGKVHDKKVTVYYESTNCTIASFGLNEE